MTSMIAGMTTFMKGNLHIEQHMGGYGMRNSSRTSRQDFTKSALETQHITFKMYRWCKVPRPRAEGWCSCSCRRKVVGRRSSALPWWPPLSHSRSLDLTDWLKTQRPHSTQTYSLEQVNVTRWNQLPLIRQISLKKLQANSVGWRISELRTRTDFPISDGPNSHHY